MTIAWDSDLHIPGQSEIKQGMSIFLMGGVGTIKTTWAASFPSPVVLAAGQEGGDDSLALLPELLGIPTPPVYLIGSTIMMKQKVEYICNNYIQYGWKTVVIDSISMYMDIYIREVILRYQKAGKALAMQQRDWGFMEAHICKELAQRLHATRLNVIWIALTKEKYSVADRSGERSLEGYEPLIQGATKIKLPAMCKMIIHADKEMRPNATGGMVSTPIYRTAPTLMVKDVRHKYGNAFSEGHLVDSQYGTWPTFNALDERIGQFIYK